MASTVFDDDRAHGIEAKDSSRAASSAGQLFHFGDEDHRSPSRNSLGPL